MSGKPKAYMPFYVADYILDTSHLSLEEHGAYLLLMFTMWRRGGELPAEHDRLARILGVTDPERFERLWDTLREFFERDGDVIRQRRLTDEWAKAMSNKHRLIKAAREAGKRSARLRKARKLGTHTEAEWQALLGAVGDRCPRCGKEADELVKDHVIPLYKEGRASDAIDNIQPLCRSCNASTGPSETDYVAGIRARLVANGVLGRDEEGGGDRGQPSPTDSNEGSKSVVTMPGEVFEPEGVRFLGTVGPAPRSAARAVSPGGFYLAEYLIVSDDSNVCPGWLCYRHPDGQWVTIRKATAADRAAAKTCPTGGRRWARVTS